MLDRQPDCSRAFQTRYEVPILAVEKEIVPAGPAFLFKSVVARLADMPGLPEPVREKLTAVRNAKSPEEQVASWLETVTALAASGRQGADRQEPSLDAVASLIREMHFVLARRQVEFAAGMAVDSSQLRVALHPWVKDHPYGAWIDVFDQQATARTAAHNKLGKAGQSEVELTEGEMIGWLNQGDAKSLAESKRLLTNHSDPIYRDLIMRFRSGLLQSPGDDQQNTATAAMLRSVSPWTSTFIALLIHIDGKGMDKEIAQARARLRRRSVRAVGIGQPAPGNEAV